MNWGKVGLFAGGVLFGTAGIKTLTSRDAKKVYAFTTAAALRAKESIEIRSFAVLLFTIPAMGVELPETFLQQGGHGELWPEHTQSVQCAKNAHADAEAF